MTLPPVPPSDSLYKFTAIGGLILVVFSLYVPWKMSSDLLITMLDIELASRKWRLEAKYLDRDMEEIKELQQENERDFDELDKILTKSKAFSASQMKGFREREADALRRLKQIEGKRRELELILLQSNNTVSKVKVLSSDASKLNWISWLTLWAGATLMVFGFSNWYFKFQVFQDRIIKSQAEQWISSTPKHQKEEIPG